MRIVSACFAAALLFAAAWPALHSPPAARPRGSGDAAPEWAQARWLPPDRQVAQLRLSSLEERFSRQFPGHLARFTDGRSEWIVRVVDAPTRMLHPATDCFRALGYAVTPAAVRRDSRGEHWRCFGAQRHGRRLQVCERIFDANDGRWTDVSSWYWSALWAGAANAHGPWWAVTWVEAENR